MINSNTNAVNTIDASNTEASPAYNPQDRPDQQPSPPSSPSPTFFQRTRSRLVLFYKSIPYSTKRKSLRNIRLLILALSFVSLILDAITLSFEVRVMNLDWSTIQRQAAMLLTPDLLAMAMTLVLLMFTSDAICCCFGNIEDVMEQEAMENEYHEEPYDYDDEEEEGEEPLHEEHQRQYRSTDQLEYSSSSHHREQHLEQQGLEYKEKKDKGRKQELYEEEEEEKEEEVLTRRGRSKVAFVNSPETIHETRVDQREAVGASSPSETPRIIITDIKTSNNTPNSTSAQPNPDAGASRSASTIPTPIITDEKPEATTTMMEELPEETVVVDGTARSRRLYTIFRIVFSIGLFILAIYWPAIDSPTPIGHLPNSGGPKYPPRSNYAQGRESTNGTGYSYEDFNRTMTFGARTRGSGYHTSNPNTPSSAKDRGWSYGYSHFCALEQTFGDNQSASVYCQVKVIRPGVTYAWAVLLILELCIAASAGDFSKNRGRPIRDFQSTETIDEEENLSGDLDGLEGQVTSHRPSSP